MTFLYVTGILKLPLCATILTHVQLSYIIQNKQKNFKVEPTLSSVPRTKALVATCVSTSITNLTGGAVLF